MGAISHPYTRLGNVGELHAVCSGPTKSRPGLEVISGARRGKPPGVVAPWCSYWPRPAMGVQLDVRC